MKRFSVKLIALTALAVLAGGLFMASPAQAQGEKYYFKDQSQQSIVGTGGAYQSDVTFSQTGQTYLGSLNYTCNNQSYQLDLHLSLTSAAGTIPAAGSLSYNPTVGSCKVDTFDQTVTIEKDQATAAANPAQSQTSDAGQCDGGAFSWFVCPFLDNIDSFAAKIGDTVLPPLLRLSPLHRSTAPGIYEAWRGVRDLSNSLLVIAFMIIVFANTLSFQLDAYAVKKALPRLIMATVLIQFSFYIAAILVDAGNVLGAGIGGIITNFAATSTPAVTGSTQGAVFNMIGLGAGIALVAIFWPLALPMAVSLLIALAAIFLTLAARFLIIYALIVLSPLAFVAWVLPSTEAYFAKWWKTFVRLILMYPIIMGILAIAGKANALLASANQLTTSGSVGSVSVPAASWLVDGLKLVVAIAAFVMIPRTFKWAGGVMSGTSEVINKFASGRQKQLHDSQWYKDQKNKVQERQLARMNRMANNPTITHLTNSESRLKRGLGQGFLGSSGLLLAGGAPSTALGRARSQSQLTNAHTKDLDDLNEQPGFLEAALNSVYAATPEERQRAANTVVTNAPWLMRYTESRSGRMAILKKLADIDLVTNDVMSSILNAPTPALRDDYAYALRAAGKMVPKNPALLQRFFQGEVESVEQPDGTKRLEFRDAGEAKVKAMSTMIRNWTAAKLRDDVSRENFTIASEDNVVADVLVDNFNPNLARSIFDPGKQTYADQNKRMDFVKMIKAQNALFMGTVKGRKIIAGMMDGMRHDEDFMDLIISDNSLTRWPGMDADDKRRVIEQWFW